MTLEDIENRIERMESKIDAMLNESPGSTYSPTSYELDVPPYFVPWRHGEDLGNGQVYIYDVSAYFNN